MLQTLVFNTTTKTVIVLDGPTLQSKILYNFSHVPTVKVSEMGYFEVMQEVPETQGRIPIARFPIANTNMLIEK